MAQYVEVNGQVIEFPDGMAAGDIESAIKANMMSIKPAKQERGTLNQMARDAFGGAIRGAGSIGATLIRPFESAAENEQRRKSMDEGLTSLVGSNPDNLTYGGTKLLTEMAGTSGVGGALAKPLMGIAPRLAQAVATSGMTAGGAGMATRAAGGAITGGASAALVNPEDAGAGAAIGAAMPGAIKLVGMAGSKIGQTYRAATQPEKVKIAQKLAQTLGASKEEIIAALEQQGPELLPGYRRTVPQILQTPEASQLQRTLKSAGVNVLGEADAIQQQQMREALNRVAPIDLSVQDAASRAGGAIQNFARPAREEASKNVRAAFDAVDPFNETSILLPRERMVAAQGKYLGDGTFGTGQRAAQALQTADDVGSYTLDAIQPAKQINPEGLAKAVRRAGGIKGQGGELRDLGRKQSGTTGLINNKSGRDLDILAEEMAQRGYINSADSDELVQALQDGIGGRGPRISFDVSDEVLQGIGDAAKGEAPGAMRVSKGVPFQTVQNLRSSIGEAAEMASAKGANKEAAALREMVAAIDDKINQVAGGRGGVNEMGVPENFPQDIADQYRQALALHADKMQRFETGPQMGMFRKGGDGQASIQGAEIPGKFFSGRRSQVEDVQAFKRLVGDKPELFNEMKRYAVTEGASTSNAQGDLTSKYVEWLKSRSGANRELFNKQELATLKEVGKAVERQLKAENLGRVSGSDTAQKIAALNNLGALDSRVVDMLANRIPVVGSFTGPMLSGLRQTAAAKRNQTIGGLLANPGELAAALRAGAAPAGGGLLDAAIERALPLTYRAAPVGLLGL